MTAADVKASYEVLLRRAESSLERSFQLGFADLERIETEGPYEILIHMHQPSTFLLSELSTPVAPANLAGKTRQADAVGTGPFMVERWGPREITLNAHRSYYQGRPGIDRIVFRTYDTLRIAWTKLVGGEIDCLYQVGPETQEFLERGSAVRLYPFLRNYYYFLGFNEQNELFRDSRVRAALNYAVNKEEIVRVALRGHAKVANGIVWPSFWAYNADLAPYRHDPIRALALLREAGWTMDVRNGVLTREGKRFEFSTIFPHADALYERIALMLQKDLLEIGVRMNCQSATLNDLYSRLPRRQFSAALIDQTAGNGFERGFTFFHSTKGLNPFSYRNSAVDELLDALRRTDDPDAVRTLATKFQQAIYDDPPGVFLFWDYRARALSRRIANVGPEGQDVISSISHWTIATEAAH